VLPLAGDQRANRSSLRLCAAHQKNFGENSLSRKQEANDAILEDLVALVEKAARTIERLQQELHLRDDRIADLEKARVNLEKDAYSYRWLQRHYGNSAFFAAMESAFRSAHADFAKSIGAKNMPSSDAGTD
jgi:hypothetical protein